MHIKYTQMYTFICGKKTLFLQDWVAQPSIEIKCQLKNLIDS